MKQFFVSAMMPNGYICSGIVSASSEDDLYGDFPILECYEICC